MIATSGLPRCTSGETLHTSGLLVGVVSRLLVQGLILSTFPLVKGGITGSF